MRNNEKINKADLIKAVGEKEAERILRAVNRCKLDRKDVERIEQELNQHGAVTLRRMDKSPRRFEIVGHRFVTINRPRAFENREIRERAVAAYRKKSFGNVIAPPLSPPES